MPDRRSFLQTGTLTTAAVLSGGFSSLTHAENAAERVATVPPEAHPILTPANSFRDVSRGNQKPHTLAGEALTEARLTPDTWRLEVVVDPFTNETVKQSARAHQQFQTQAIHRVKCLNLFATVGKVQFAIAQYSINIKCQ